MSSLTAATEWNTSIFIFCSLIAFLSISVWAWIKIKFKQPCLINLLMCCPKVNLHQRDQDVNLPPVFMRKAPPPTLPDALRRLQREEVFHTDHTIPVVITGGVVTKPVVGKKGGKGLPIPPKFPNYFVKDKPKHFLNSKPIQPLHDNMQPQSDTSAWAKGSGPVMSQPSASFHGNGEPSAKHALSILEDFLNVDENNNFPTPEAIHSAIKY